MLRRVHVCCVCGCFLVLQRFVRAQYAAGLVRRSLEMCLFAVYIYVYRPQRGLRCIVRRICKDARAKCCEGSAGSRSGTVSVHAAVRARSARAAPQSCLALRKRSRGD